MSEIKWIKITTDMFEDEKIDFISSLPDADAIIVIWIRLLTLAGKCNAGGYVLLTEKIPYTEEMLAHKFKKPISTVKMALETFRRLDMIDMDGHAIYLPNWEKHQNVEGMERIRQLNRERKRKERERKKLLKDGSSQLNDGKKSESHAGCHVTRHVTSQPSHATDIDIDITTTTTTETVADVYTKIFNEFSMNGLFTDYIRRLFNNGYTESFVKEVLYEMGESGTRPSFRLFQAICERWISEGIYTRAEAKQRKKPRLSLAKSDKTSSRTAAQLAIDREIAFNKWVEEGGDPNEFKFDVS